MTVRQDVNVAEFPTSYASRTDIKKTRLSQLIGQLHDSCRGLQGSWRGPLFIHFRPHGVPSSVFTPLHCLCSRRDMMYGGLILFDRRIFVAPRVDLHSARTRKCFRIWTLEVIRQHHATAVSSSLALVLAKINVVGPTIYWTLQQGHGSLESIYLLTLSQSTSCFSHHSALEKTAGMTDIILQDQDFRDLKDKVVLITGMWERSHLSKRALQLTKIKAVAPASVSPQVFWQRKMAPRLSLETSIHYRRTSRLRERM